MIRGDLVRIGIEAPRQVTILREELGPLRASRPTCYLALTSQRKNTDSMSLLDVSFTHPGQP